MADAVTDVLSAGGNGAVDPDAPLAVQTWEGRGVGLGQVIAALPELRRQGSGRGAGTRTAVMTIVMVIGPNDDPEVTAAPVRALGVVEAPVAAIAGRRVFQERLSIVQWFAGAMVAIGVAMTALG
jgi:hypothetical protein